MSTQRAFEMASDQRTHLRDAAQVAGVTLPEIVLPAEHTLDADGLALHYLDWGTPGLRPVVFLHGGSLTAHTWDLVCLALRTQFHCLAPDLRGHGDSGWSPDADYRLESHSADVARLVDTRGLRDFVLVGMSLGGLVSLVYAAAHVEQLAALVLVDVGPEIRSPGSRRIAEFVSASVELESVEAFVQRAIAFNPRRRPDLLRRSLLHNLRQTPSGSWTWKYDQRLHSEATRRAGAQRRANLWSDVSKITCPTLVVRGGQSDVFFEEDADKLSRTLARGSHVTIEGAGHTVQGDQPARLVEELGRFLAAVIA
jgi:pimeloyl-ACP methyl ester carboxylesterase